MKYHNLFQTNVHSIKECATILEVTPQTLYKWIRLGTFPVLRLGKRVFVSDETLQRYRSAPKLSKVDFSTIGDRVNTINVEQIDPSSTVSKTSPDTILCFVLPSTR